MVAVPVFVILPEARGVPAAGRTRMFCQVNVLGVLPLLCAVIVILIVLVVTVAVMVAPSTTSLMLWVDVELPFTRTVTVTPVLKTNPLGAFRIMSPRPTFAVADST